MFALHKKNTRAYAQARAQTPDNKHHGSPKSTSPPSFRDSHSQSAHEMNQMNKERQKQRNKERKEERKKGIKKERKREKWK